MYRRQYVVGVAVVALAGCSGDGSSSPSDQPATATRTPTETATETPERPVVQHYEALDRNDFEAANAAIHADSPQGELSEEAIERARSTDYTIDSVEVSDGDTETPEVQVSVTAENTDSGETQVLDLRIEVRKEDGVWKMYSIL